ncbi:MAG: AAA family ATPase [Thermodesulfobacteriota bacterium]
MDEPKISKPVVIAVCGKGGVGKTSISAVMTRILSGHENNKVLAVDADPAAGLAGALGFTAARTVDQIRSELIERIRQNAGGDRGEIIARMDYEVLEALEEDRNIAFLAIGRPELEGCYCQVNRFLKEIIAAVAAGFDFVVIDGEAGVEQINRRVMETVTHLVLVSDASVRGLRVAETILGMAAKAVAHEKSGLILNRLRGPSERERLRIPAAAGILGWIPEDDTVRNFDIAGRNFLELPDCSMMRGVSEFLEKLGVIPVQA